MRIRVPEKTVSGPIALAAMPQSACLKKKTGKSRDFPAKVLEGTVRWSPHSPLCADRRVSPMSQARHLRLRGLT